VVFIYIIHAALHPSKANRDEQYRKMSSQDWDRVVIKPKAVSGGKKPAPGADGAPTEKKFTAGSNSGAKGVDGQSLAKLDRETEELSHKKVGLGLAKAIQQARMAKKMTQAKLAQAINEKPQVINQYENGSAIPNGQLIAKIERALGCKLPRK
jgi:putative transcription factor